MERSHPLKLGFDLALAWVSLHGHDHKDTVIYHYYLMSARGGCRVIMIGSRHKEKIVNCTSKSRIM